MRQRVMLGAGAIVALGLLVGAGTWFFVLREDAPPPVDLGRAVGDVARSSAPAGGSGAPVDGASLEGTWRIASDAGSFVGYRVNEQLARMGASTAVGRTSAVEGTLAFDGRAITSVEVTADARQLRSDESNRDRQLRTQGLETNRYPSVSFALTKPIALEPVPAAGESIDAVASGNLTIHGVTREVALPLSGQLADGRVVVVGSTVIEFADYGIAPPKALSVLSVEERAVVEFQLVFTRA